MREVIHDPHLHAVDGPVVGATAEAEAGVTADRGPDPYLNRPEGAAGSVMPDQGALAIAGAPGDHSPQQRKWIAAPHLMATRAPDDPSPQKQRIMVTALGAGG